MSFILTGGRKSVPRIVEEGDCGTLLPLTDVEHVEETSEKGALEGRAGGSADGGAAAAIGGGGGRADGGLKWNGSVARLVRDWREGRGREHVGAKSSYGSLIL